VQPVNARAIAAITVQSVRMFGSFGILMEMVC
jgi:hypothetical protein